MKIKIESKIKKEEEIGNKNHGEMENEKEEGK